ncbi:MAG: spore germination protein, partial [Firmicutes bacterium]|nr:spore germination protein [Bacillota bacterium]
PAYEMGTPWRILFWALVLAANFLGVFGIVLVGSAVVTYLAALEDFGVPYLSPSGPWRWRDLLDSWIRAPYRVMARTRPVAWQPVNIRQGTFPPRPAVADVDLGAAQEQRHDD